MAMLPRSTRTPCVFATSAECQAFQPAEGKAFGRPSRVERVASSSENPHGIVTCSVHCHSVIGNDVLGATL